MCLTRCTLASELREKERESTKDLRVTSRQLARTELRPDSLVPRPRCFRPSRRRPRRTAWSSTTVSTSPSAPWSTRPPLVDSPTARPASRTQAARCAATLRAGCAADTAAPVAPAGHASAACPLFCVRVGSANHGRTWPASCGAAAIVHEHVKCRRRRSGHQRLRLPRLQQRRQLSLPMATASPSCLA